MKPIKVNFTNKNEKRTSTTINGEIADAYFRSIVEYNSPELRESCESIDKYRKAMIEKCQKFINEYKGLYGKNNWIDKGMIERYMIAEIVKIKIRKL